MDDTHLKQAIKITIQHGYASISLLQRKMLLNYFNARMLFDVMLRDSIIDSNNHKCLIETVNDYCFKTLSVIKSE